MESDPPLMLAATATLMAAQLAATSPYTFLYGDTTSTPSTASRLTSPSKCPCGAQGTQGQAQTEERKAKES